MDKCVPRFIPAKLETGGKCGDPDFADRGVGRDHEFGLLGLLEVLFEEPEEAKFVISPNTPVREIWVSALSTSFKLGWSESRNAFVHEKTGDDLLAVMSRVISKELGAAVTL